MLTHTIRALVLVALVVVAHTLRPFSTSNVIVFANQAISSATGLLPEKTLERWQDFGLLAALVTGNSDPFTSRFANTSENVVVARSNSYELGKPVKKMVSMIHLGGTSRRFERTISSQGRRSTNFGGVPMPFIPDLESSLISNPSLMAFPPVIPVQGLELPTRASGSGVWEQHPFDNFAHDEEAVSEENSWVLETSVQKPIPATIPNLTLRMLVPLQRTNSNALACPQPAKSTKGIVSVKGQSC